ncbi:unnamed protein product [Caenorhabditis angaria]|uniref:Uncharacterized protein n=1 Tax=Caenorhabditis angaria TaxID=860376 RepID=A0A9P1I9B1_9PELO|nr:unnamed protein product [Caenorhabditis angaria]
MPRKQKIVADDNWRQDDLSIGWFDIPLEMREMVINEMDVKTRSNIKIRRYLHREIWIGLGERFDEDTPHYHYCLEFINDLKSSEPQTKVVYHTVQREWVVDDYYEDLKKRNEMDEN